MVIYDPNVYRTYYTNISCPRLKTEEFRCPYIEATTIVNSDLSDAVSKTSLITLSDTSTLDFTAVNIEKLNTNELNCNSGVITTQTVISNEIDVVDATVDYMSCSTISADTVTVTDLRPSYFGCKLIFNENQLSFAGGDSICSFVTPGPNSTTPNINCVLLYNSNFYSGGTGNRFLNMNVKRDSDGTVDFAWKMNFYDSSGAGLHWPASRMIACQLCTGTSYTILLASANCLYSGDDVSISIMYMGLT